MLPDWVGSLVKLQKTVSIDFWPLIKYNPFMVCPVRQRSSQELDTRSIIACPLQTSLPRVCTPDDVDSWVRPK